MKTQKSGVVFVGGLLLGLTLAFGLGAGEKSKEPPRKDFSQLKITAYPNGGTAVFDPDTGTFYVYDSNLQDCYLIRQITTLGEPTRRP